MSNVRLIDANALIRTACEKFYTTNYYSHILEMIDNAPTIEPKQEWIPCSERLPEPYSGIYLCCGKDGTLMILNYDSLGNGDYTVAFYYTDDDGYAVTPNVIAWMPLPPAYQPKERSE